MALYGDAILADDIYRDFHKDKDSSDNSSFPENSELYFKESEKNVIGKMYSF